MNPKPEFVGTVNRLPNAICAAFIQWLLNGGYVTKSKKDGMHLKRGDKVVIIYCKNGVVDPSYLMNDCGVDRFKLFSKQWLLADKRFVEGLSNSMCAKFSEIKAFAIDKQYLKVA